MPHVTIRFCTGVQQRGKVVKLFNQIIFVTVASNVLCIFLETNSFAREWTDNTGVFSVQAEFVKVEGENVTLRKGDGTLVSVPIQRLSKGDQDYLKQQRGAPPKVFDKIEAALAQMTTAEFVETPLRDVVSFLSNQHKIPILLDIRALDLVGIGEDTPITARAAADSLGTLIDRVLKDLELTWMARHEVLMITTPEEADSSLLTRVYKVARMINADSLISDLTKNINPNSWSDVGGPGSLSYVAGRVLVVAQTDRVHRKIAKHYGNQLTPVGAQQAQIPSIPGLEFPVKALTAPTRAEFVKTPLVDVIRYFESRHNVAIHLDTRSLDLVGIGSDCPISINVNGVQLSNVLRLMLRNLELTWRAGKSGITITTPESDEKELFLAGYKASDLSKHESFADIIDTVTTVVHPASWDKVGGPASLRKGIRGTLDVRQNFQGHLAVARLLADLRIATNIKE